MRKIFALMIVWAGIAAVFNGCVTKQKYNDVNNSLDICEQQRRQLSAQKTDLDNKVLDMDEQLKNATAQVATLTNDTLLKGRLLRELQTNHQNLEKDYQDLLSSYKNMNTGNKAELEAMLARLNGAQQQLDVKEKELNDLAADLAQRNNQLNEQNARLMDLQNILDKKDADVKALKDKIKHALKGFDGSGLAIAEKDGKVYVSMDEKLLFASGKFTIDQKGEEALRALANILAADSNINVLVEGHTDNVPFTPSASAQIKDNWDLSVMRATTVVRTILKNGNIQPQRLTAAGRGEFFPLQNDDSKEARAKNRRTEIILTPNLNALLEVLK